jgi:hypothetical protein
VALLGLHHLVLTRDQSPIHDRHHELLLDELENFVVPLLLMMVDLDCLCQPELVLEPLMASLHRSPFKRLIHLGALHHLQGFTNLLSLIAVRFIKFHVYRGLNTTGGFVENTIGMLVSSITNEKTFINLGCKL